MRLLIQDIDIEYNSRLADYFDDIIYADGKYSPCQGCFGCWTKHPAECFMKDKLKQVCRVIGQADELVIVTKNCYGSYSPAVKNIIDRSIGDSTPLSTYRGKQMHHTLRYGKHYMLKVIAYGDMNENERSTMKYLAERKAINSGYNNVEFYYLTSMDELEEKVK